MLRISLLLGAACLVIPMSARAQVRLYGDCETPPDGVVNVLDGLQASRHSVGLDPLPFLGSPDFLGCDVNDDGVINVLDSFSISNYSVGRLVPEPVGQVIPNALPVAQAGGPYSGVLGGPVALDGSASSDDHPPLASFAWDLDDNGSFEASGATVTFGCASVGGFTVRLRVTDSFGLQSVDASSVSCSLPVDLYAQWTNAAEAPITTAAVGASIFLNICTPISGTQAFQAIVTLTGAVSRTTGGSDLQAATAGGICGDPGANDVVTQYTGQAPPANPFNFQNYSVSPSAGSGQVGLARIPFTAQAAGPVNVTIQVVVWALFGGQAPASPAVLVGALTVN
jgi:hypothetical protein